MKFILLLTLFADSSAPISGRGFTCDVIRSYVAIHGEKAAEKWAKQRRWTKERIAEARRCLVR